MEAGVVPATRFHRIDHPVSRTTFSFIDFLTIYALVSSKTAATLSDLRDRTKRYQPVQQGETDEYRISRSVEKFQIQLLYFSRR